jgi:hypothetical protein
MVRRSAGMYTMEMMTLASFFCIVAVFLIAHYDLAVAAKDSSAKRAATQIAQLAPEVFNKAPQAKLDLEQLKTAGLETGEELGIKISPDQNTAENWQVIVWHQEGNHEYVVSAKGITKRPR